MATMRNRVPALLLALLVIRLYLISITLPTSDSDRELLLRNPSSTSFDAAPKTTSSTSFDAAPKITQSLPQSLPLPSQPTKPLSSRPKLTRRNRFPTVEERVQLYMSNWYLPPCHFNERIMVATDGENVHVENMTILPRITPDKLFHLNEDIVRQCARSEEEREKDLEKNITSALESYIGPPKARGNMGMYCRDVLEMIDIIPLLSNKSAPVFLQFGDMKHSHEYGVIQIPHFRKFRSATNDLQSVTGSNKTCVAFPRPRLPVEQGDDAMQPIVWKLATSRHYKFLPKVKEYDIPWAAKKDMAVFRGQLTGALENFDKKRSAHENCASMARCHLVLSHANSSLVDAKLTTTRKRLPEVLNGVELVESKMPVEDQLKYKGLIMLEGNDVASGLKWALLSKSVVLMPKPKHTSWAMEERLEPWVHYVPINEKTTDVEEKVKWILQNPKRAQRISLRASTWIIDLLYHRDSARDERLVKEEMIRRYQSHFVSTSKS